MLCGSYMSPPRDKTACQTSPCKCKICISSIESDVHNKKKWKNVYFSWSEKMYISFVPSALMKYTFFHFTRWNKSHIHDKHLNILYIFQLLYIIILCVCRYQFTFVPFSNLVNIYFKYFKNLSSLQFQNSLYRHSLFYTLKVALIILFLELSLLL